MNDRLRRVLTTLVILACIGLLIVAAQHTRRGDTEDATTTGGNSVVQLMQPTPESSVLSQAQVLIYLTVNYKAHLSINSVSIPDEQTVYKPELVEVSFLPGPGKVLERLPQGRNCVRADISRVDGVSEVVPPASWCFNVT
jgi:hypothetical protein